MELGMMLVAVLVVGIAIGRFVLSGRTGSGGATVTIDGITVAFTRNELLSIFAQLTDEEAQSLALARRYSDHGQRVPEDARVASDVAFTNAARRWLSAHPEVAQRKGFASS